MLSLTALQCYFQLVTIYVSYLKQTNISCFIYILGDNLIYDNHNESLKTPQVFKIIPKMNWLQSTG